MQNVLFTNENEPYEADVLIVLDKRICKAIDKKLKGALSYNLKREQFDWEPGRSVWMTTNGLFPIPKIVVTTDLSLQIEEQRVAVAIGDLIPRLATYKWLSKSLSQTETVIFLCKDPKEAQKTFESSKHLLEAVRHAKMLIEAPANLMTPTLFAKECRRLEKQGVHVTVFDEKELKKIGAEALLAVGQGSANPPRMVIMEWKGSKEDPIVLVGKGICFDAGGIHLKTSHLNEMKWDKAGAGTVVGTIDAVSRLKLPVSVVGIAVLAENMPDGAAMKPGDIISTLGGKRVEIADTDCEGRLALADGLSYAQQAFSPRTLIDLGTLTLETFGALGGAYSGLFCKDKTLATQLIGAGEASGERLWPLPLGEYYANQIRSKIADLKNCGVFRYGASSAAAEFLHAFVKPGLPWAHIDIAGTAWQLDAPEKGVTGVGIKLLVAYLKANL